MMPPTFIRFAVSRKNGTASRMNELYALNVVLNSDHRRQARLDEQDRQAGQAERERHRHAQHHQREERAEQDRG